MTTATPPPPVTYNANSRVGGQFTTPEQIREYAESVLAEKSKIVDPGLQPTVEVLSKPSGGWVVKVSVTGEGFGPSASVARPYQASRLMDEFQVRSAVWLQYAEVMGILWRSIPTTPED